ncbi:UDP-glucose 4-epimerase GalE [Kallotenue papyrolyticum]|uniref:UDP-glucose 4-epimerase GalE n=1 Tax=Kallotenue papyrolyticum TaxID=1325125 RepID=UPI0004785579|nr:UDP-glucose 4-epimerase GalE [Kallotenue papyrolyticum]
MKVLVTGGAGYIGSHTVRLLRERGYEVVVLDSLEYGHRAAIGDTPLIQGDTADGALLRRIFQEQGTQAVIHFAAYKAAGESMEQPGRYFENNVCGSLALLRAMQAANVRFIVFSSSCAVYGTPAQLPVGEDHPLHPESPYGESKRMVEQMLHWFDICHGLRYASLRYFNAAGAWPDASMGEDWRITLNLIPLVMKAALGVIPRVQVFGTDYPTPDGTAIRDYIHVLDLADAHVRALEYIVREDRSAIFNLGTGQGSSVQEVIDMARRVSGVDIPVEYTARRKGDPVAIYADNRKARQLLGWQPQYGLEEIIRHAWQWHSTHPHGYAD